MKNELNVATINVFVVNTVFALDNSFIDKTGSTVNTNLNFISKRPSRAC